MLEYLTKVGIVVNQKKVTMTSIDTYPKHFQEFYDIYPRSRFSGLKRTFKQWKARLNNGFDEAQIVDITRVYMDYCKKKNTLDDYIKLSYVFLGENFGDTCDVENWKSYEKQEQSLMPPSEWRRKLFYVIKTYVNSEIHSDFLRRVSDWNFLPKDIKKMVCDTKLPTEVDRIKVRIDALPSDWKSKLLEKFPDAGEAIGKAGYDAFKNGMYLYVLEEAENLKMNNQEELDNSNLDFNPANIVSKIKIP